MPLVVDERFLATFQQKRVERAGTNSLKRRFA